MATFNNVIDLMTRNYLFRNLYLIQEDIDRAGDAVPLGYKKKIPVRWPFILQADPPNFRQVNGAPATLMLAMPK
jgi:hypothetical protein